MLNRFKQYVYRHRLDDDAYINVAICTKIAYNISNQIINNDAIRDTDIDKLFEQHEIERITKAYQELEGQ